jgi:hypothetical protein
MKRLILILILVLGLSCYHQSQTIGRVHKNYRSELKAIAQARQELAEEYKRTENKKATIEKARVHFLSSLNKVIFPEWFGTKWDFYGTTETPRKGKVACGYFVTTVLRDTGVRVQRVKLAQQASENIIKSLTSEKFIKRFRNTDIDDFVTEIIKSGEGLYIIGLDFHVGFIYYDRKDVWFIHSSYAEPQEVIKENALRSVVLISSKYRVTGKISADDSFILKWLNQTEFPTVRR